MSEVVDQFLGGRSLLRIYCQYDRKLLKEPGHCARESLEIFSSTALSLDVCEYFCYHAFELRIRLQGQNLAGISPGHRGSPNHFLTAGPGRPHNPGYHPRH